MSGPGQYLIRNDVIKLNDSTTELIQEYLEAFSSLKRIESRIQSYLPFIMASNMISTDFNEVISNIINEQIKNSHYDHMIFSQMVEEILAGRHPLSITEVTKR